MDKFRKIDTVINIVLVVMLIALAAFIVIGGLSAVYNQTTLTGYERTATFGAEQFHAQQTAIVAETPEACR